MRTRTGEGTETRDEGEQWRCSGAASVVRQLPVQDNRRRKRDFYSKPPSHDDREAMNNNYTDLPYLYLLDKNSSTTTIGDIINLHMHNKSTYL